MAPWDGSGNVTRTNGTNSGQSVWQDDRDDGVNIRADRHDTHDEDLANSLENTVALDGQNTTTTDNAIIRYATGTDNKFVEVTIAANQVPLRVGTGNLSGFTVGTNTLLGRKAGDIEAIAIGTASGEIPLADDVLKADPEHATDGGTDAYASATNTTPPADGVQIVRDFQSSNTTTTPTLDGKTITDRDGNALWASAISGPHTLQRDQTADTYLLLDPRPTAANINNAPVKRDASGNAKGSDPVSAQDFATKASSEAYADAGDATLGTVVDATNGGSNNLTEVDFTGIKSGAKRITISFRAISASGTDNFLVQIGDSGGFETSGYVSTGNSFDQASGSDGISSTSGYAVRAGSAVNALSGVFTLERQAGNRWVASHVMKKDGSRISVGGGEKELSAELDRIRITLTGTDTFDGGNLNIMVE